MRPMSKQGNDAFNGLHAEDRKNAHKGLLFDRFFNGYNAVFQVEDNAKTQELNKLIGQCGDASQIEAAAARRVDMMAALDGEFAVFSTDGYFVTGMGNSHPAENGFSWHPTLGTPYLPGSSVKGLLRAWMETMVHENPATHAAQQQLHDWFGRDAGAQDSKDSGKAGSLIFFDAIPVATPRVVVDIMTPHMGKWYERGGEQLDANSTPGDWHNPVPVSFLATADARFLFAVAPRTQAAKPWVSEAMEQLTDALAWLGAGAKTATGYGHMSPEGKLTQNWMKQAAQAGMTEGDKVLDDLRELQAVESPDKNKLNKLIRSIPEMPDKELPGLEDAEPLLDYFQGLYDKKDKVTKACKKVRQHLAGDNNTSAA